MHRDARRSPACRFSLVRLLFVSAPLNCGPLGRRRKKKTNIGHRCGSFLSKNSRWIKSGGEAEPKGGERKINERGKGGEIEDSFSSNARGGSQG